MKKRTCTTFRSSHYRALGQPDNHEPLHHPQEIRVMAAAEELAGMFSREHCRIVEQFVEIAFLLSKRSENHSESNNNKNPATP